MTTPIEYGPLLDCPLFDGLSREQKETLLSECTLQRFDAPTDILRQGETTPVMYLILKGRVEVIYLDKQGNAAVLHVAGPGEVLGEVEGLSGTPCSSSCRTLPEAMVLACSFELLLKHIPPALLLRNSAAIMQTRLTRDNELRAIAQFFSVEERLRMYLHQFTTEAHREARLSQSYLASMVGCSRQTINKLLGDLRRDGVIEIRRGAIAVLDRERLKIEV
ncbi:Crp/Fnr family transcriptional regulator [Alloyangia pacifica]|uniref:Crp/Fnr family transcriptional regulator n=1 Tax=Alloyangia pacifica TaxID=311180 RepID=A0A2U8HC27_9RHOB|nr:MULTISPECIES: Crp/Fnr family transcriptional regulator [Roseobacteraceae]AWI83324.1 Crp/Fnr family transcriptional regulator [Alloyangia pacifica]NDV51927.1 Crp/Fnr family transcriptional regulator [Salipiger sp. PrR003]NDW31100.1 Crp/Fnr family transcriptional regulator [Salipiger sp. PrR007]